MELLDCSSAHLGRNLLFDFKHGDNDTPISLVRDIVSLFQYKMSLKEKAVSNTR